MKISKIEVSQPTRRKAKNGGQRMLPRPFCGLLLLVLQRFRGDLGIELHALDDQRLVFRVAIDQPLITRMSLRMSSR